LGIIGAVAVRPQRSGELAERTGHDVQDVIRTSEPAVNELLGRFFEDHATLRRQLVDEGFVDRAGGECRRSGGRVVCIVGRARRHAGDAPRLP